MSAKGTRRPGLRETLVTNPRTVVAYLALAAVVVWIGARPSIVGALIAMVLGVVLAVLIHERWPAPRWVLVALFLIFPPVALIIVPVAFLQR